jgi:hypothetical protein
MECDRVRSGLCSELSTAKDIARTPVLMVGSGTGAKDGE